MDHWSLWKQFCVLHLSDFSQVKNMQNLYLPDNQLIIIYTCSWPSEKYQVESMRHEFSDSIKPSSCVPPRQELPVICYGGTVWWHYMRFTGPPSRFSCSNCHSGTAIQTSSTVAGIYGIRRRQAKCCGRFVPLWAVLALDCCRVSGTWSSSIDKVHAVRQKPHLRGQRRSKSWPCP